MQRQLILSNQKVIPLCLEITFQFFTKLYHLMMEFFLLPHQIKSNHKFNSSDDCWCKQTLCLNAVFHLANNWASLQLATPFLLIWDSSHVAFLFVLVWHRILKLLFWFILQRWWFFLSVWFVCLDQEHCLT